MSIITGTDLLGLGVSFAYAFSLIGVAEGVRHWRSYPQDFTRKIVHVGAGMWVFGVLALFEHWYVGVSIFATFIILNYIAYRYRILGAVDDEDSSPGTIYFAISITMLFLFFWRKGSPTDHGYIAAAATMAMTWGDALASIVGRRWGRHRYTIGKDTRSYEGSIAMFTASSIAMFLTLYLVPGSALCPTAQPLPLTTCIASAASAACLATIAEGVSPSGTDNLSVPLLAGLVLFATITLMT